jgi:hypothetical protein
MGFNPRDVILIAAILALAAAAFWPTGEDAPTAPTPAPVVEPAGDTGEEEPAGAEPGASPWGEGTTAGAAEPLEGVSHELFPIVAGSRWVYQVSGPKHLAPDETWTLAIVSEPSADEPGAIEVGFGEALERRSLWLEEGVLRLDGLPCVEPLQFRGDRPHKVGGSFLPALKSIVAGAVWSHEYRRKVEHELRDDRGRTHRRKAAAVQRDRATMKDVHEVSVPAGRFDSHRIEWSGRITLTVGKRPILDALTAEPFRAETTWFARGVGLVRRRVSYAGSVEDTVTFNLVRYERPGG